MAVRRGTREKAFAKRLTQALADNRPDCPPVYGRLIWVKRELAHHKIEITQEAVRQWLEGKQMPRRQTMAALAKMLRVEEPWLAMGVQPMAEDTNPDRLRELEAVLRTIEEKTTDDEIRALVASTRK